LGFEESEIELIKRLAASEDQQVRVAALRGFVLPRVAEHLGESTEQLMEDLLETDYFRNTAEGRTWRMLKELNQEMDMLAAKLEDAKGSLATEATPGPQQQEAQVPPCVQLQ
jgi:hypothetical protein